MQILEGKLHEALKEIVLKRAPQEAVGLLDDDGRIIELTNHSSEPESNFEIRRDELISALEGKLAAGLTLWHSHPGGGVGPSRTDMQQRLPFIDHLVISVVDGDLVYTYY